MNIIRMEAHPDCILCSCRGQEIYQELPDRLFGVPGTFNIRQCPSCRLLWLDPRPEDEDLPKCYSTYYTHQDPSSEGVTPRRRPFSAWRDTLRKAILCGYFGYRHLHPVHDLWCESGTLLAKIPFLRYRAVYDDLRERFPRWIEREDRLIIDVGCGRGDYLRRMKELGWNVLGIEPDRDAAELAKKKGVDVITGTLQQAGLPDGIADQVTLQHSIEHFPDPIAAIQECYRLLRGGGRVVIYTPNGESLGHRTFKSSWLPLDPPRHLFLFSTSSMELFLEKTPFRKHRIKTVPASAANIYDSSLLIQKEGSINPASVTHQKGRRLFSWKELFLCLFGVPRGEELEVILYKEAWRNAIK